MGHDSILSQEEIDALLRQELKPAAEEKQFGTISDMEIDALGELGNISIGTSATTLSSLLGRKVVITTPKVKTATRDNLRTEYPLPHIMVTVRYREGLMGSNVLVLRKDDALAIADLMMGGDGTGHRELDELTLSAVAEAMNQMMGSATTALSTMFDRKIDIYPPEVAVVDFASEEFTERLGKEYDEVVQVLFKMEIENLLDSEIMQLIPLSYAKDMVSTLLGGVAEPATEVVSEPVVASRPKMTAREPETPEPQAPRTYAAAAPSWTQEEEMAASGNVKKGRVEVKPVQFAPLAPERTYQEPRNIDLILDVPLEVTVELGKTKKSIREILELGPGSIIQLDKLAGEPVDLLVNGKLIAKGEVVVIDETYGIRITTIISPMDRMTRLQ